MSQISVIIPTYNRTDVLPRCLDSVFRQTRPADEVIVIDDGSNDGSSKLITAEYPQVKLIQQANGGVSLARNRGIRQASGEWIALLDSDDEWLPEKLAQQEQHMESNPNAILIHTEEIWIRNGTRVNAMDKHQKRGGNIFHHCLPLCCISPSSAMIRRDVFDVIGYFDEDLPACEDYDLWLKICSRWPVEFIDEPLLIKYGGNADQLSRKHWGMDRFRIYALNKLLDSGELNSEQRQQAITVILKKLNIFLKGARKHNNTEYVEEFGQLLYKYEPELQ